MNRKDSFLYVIAVTIVIGLVLLSSCRYNENFYEKSDAFVEFSKDTVRFDTVFTTVGSATRSFKISNPYNETLMLTRVHLEKGGQSFFRLNVNGTDGNDIEGTEIRPNDSIYVFVEVTIDPNLPVSSSPFIIEDYVNISVNGNEQKVILEAWGQNANYVPSTNAAGDLSILTCDLDKVIWDDPKPYVIYGILLIDSCTLELPPGANVYIHGGIATRDDIGTYNDGRIIILKDGSIASKGTIDQPVFIQGDRLEPEYNEIAAQWTGIQIFPESKNNLFENTKILDGIIGLSIDSAASATILNSQISNHASRSLIAYHVDELTIQNSLFHSASAETVLLKYGGKINIDYSTIVGYSNQQSAMYADNFRCTEQIFCGPILVNPLDLNVRNTIISGNGSDELVLIDGTFGEVQNVLNFEWENCLIKMDTLLNAQNFPNFFDRCIGCKSIDTREALFIDIEMVDFHLDTLSQAEMIAKPISGIFEDIEGNIRDIANPDAGCYEYQY